MLLFQLVIEGSVKSCMKENWCCESPYKRSSLKIMAYTNEKARG